jgi:hypothetical protein
MLLMKDLSEMAAEEIRQAGFGEVRISRHSGISSAQPMDVVAPYEDESGREHEFGLYAVCTVIRIIMLVVKCSTADLRCDLHLVKTARRFHVSQSEKTTFVWQRMYFANFRPSSRDLAPKGHVNSSTVAASKAPRHLTRFPRSIPGV